MNSKFESLTLVELKAELKKRHAKVSGRKKELVERFEAYERNYNSGKNDEPEPEYYMTLPDSKLYKDANADTKFCPLVLDTIINYLDQFEKELDDHSKKLYNDKLLLFFRIATENGITFVKTKIKAEYLKTEYNVDISFTADGESQCECGAGMGPAGHCKHICCTLYASLKFATTGVGNHWSWQPLELLSYMKHAQKSYKPSIKQKKFIWSPLKAKDLKLQGADEFTSIDFDPTPEHLRQNPGYADFFRNTCLNFQGISSMPIFQLFTPANTQAVAHDHDYLKLTPEDSFLETLCVTKISDEERLSVERRTLGQDKNPLWYEERTKRLASSMFGRICKQTDINSQSQ